MKQMADNKKILLIHYSQTGQLSRIAESLIAPLRNSGNVEVESFVLEPVTPYPFPWPFMSFFDVFPESVYLDPPELKPLEIDENEHFDLVILAYQVWFLSPSLPVTAFLKSEIGRKILQGKPVITLIGCRNMWAMAQQTVKRLLDEAHSELIDNIVFIDQGSALASFITTPRWLLTGKSNAFWGLPPAGVSQQQIDGAGRFGRAILAGLTRGKETSGEPLLSGLRAVEANPDLILSEKVGYRSFRIWGKLLRKMGPPGSMARKPVLLVYLCFLVLMIITVVPINMLLKKLLSPLLRKKYQKIKQEHELPSGSGSEKMDEFT